MSVLVDTSVWSLALRRREKDLSGEQQELVEELKVLIREGRARVLGLVRQELLSGIRTHAQYERLRKVMRAFPDETVSAGDFERAALMSNQCRSKGVAVSVVDALICEIARSRQWSIFTTDPDFRHYAGVLPIKLHAPAE